MQAALQAQPMVRVLLLSGMEIRLSGLVPYHLAMKTQQQAMGRSQLVIPISQRVLAPLRLAQTIQLLAKAQLRQVLKTQQQAMGRSQLVTLILRMASEPLRSAKATQQRDKAQLLRVMQARRLAKALLRLVMQIRQAGKVPWPWVTRMPLTELARQHSGPTVQPPVRGLWQTAFSAWQMVKALWH